MFKFFSFLVKIKKWHFIITSRTVKNYNEFWNHNSLNTCKSTPIILKGSIKKKIKRISILNRERISKIKKKKKNLFKVVFLPGKFATPYEEERFKNIKKIVKFIRLFIDMDFDFTF